MEGSQGSYCCNDKITDIQLSVESLRGHLKRFWLGTCSPSFENILAPCTNFSKMHIPIITNFSKIAYLYVHFIKIIKMEIILCTKIVKRCCYGWSVPKTQKYTWFPFHVRCMWMKWVSFTKKCLILKVGVFNSSKILSTFVIHKDQDPYW